MYKRQIQHTVTFNAVNGTTPVQVKVQHGSTVEKPADPVKTDDTFLGWHTASGCLFYTSSPPPAATSIPRARTAPTA